MQLTNPLNDRRRFLGLIVGIASGALLGGCDRSDRSGRAASALRSFAEIPGQAAAAAKQDGPTHPLNLALNFAYLGAQYYSYAASGAGLPPNLTDGIGVAGVPMGARRASLNDPIVAALAVDLASDKRSQVADLRARIGALAATQPQLDLSTGPFSAFSLVGWATGMTPVSSVFDPYANDESFLFGAFLFENAAAAMHRTLIIENDDADELLRAHLTDSIYHGGVVRALLDDQASTNPAVATGLAEMSKALAIFDRSNMGDQAFVGDGTSSNLMDANNRPIPFTRAKSQILAALYLSGNGTAGGFLPAGANGIPE